MRYNSDIWYDEVEHFIFFSNSEYKLQAELDCEESSIRCSMYSINWSLLTLNCLPRWRMKCMCDSEQNIVCLDSHLKLIQLIDFEDEDDSGFSGRMHKKWF
ncbi:hypothetical protein H5410_029697 [Solanum commersonii]|uniref:Uncharacterized protein n=1 Tax=Solanum commersonii TaxID=4109 RepID=A0A9J5YER8_SOLCO|nr:hypothetical protein H5410_029697 [Solanum commersonii]